MIRMLLCCFALTGVMMSAVIASPPFPAGMTIQNPANVSDQSRAGLLGIWIGDFGTRDNNVGLAVTNVNADGTLSVIYAVEENDPSLSHAKPPMRAVLQGDTLHLPPFSSGAVVTFELRRNGSLRGTYAREGSRRARGTFRKAN